MDAHVRDFRNMTRGGDVAPEVPDHLVRIGEPLREEAAAVLRGEHAGIAPTHAREGAFVLLIAGVDLEDVDDQQVARLGASTWNGPVRTCTPASGAFRTSSAES